MPREEDPVDQSHGMELGTVVSTTKATWIHSAGSGNGTSRSHEQRGLAPLLRYAVEVHSGLAVAMAVSTPPELEPSIIDPPTDPPTMRPGIQGSTELQGHALLVVVGTDSRRTSAPAPDFTIGCV